MQVRVAPSSEIDQFLFLITHDLKADLRGLQEVPGWIFEDMQTAGLTLPKDIAGHLTLLHTSAQRLSHSIERLGQYAQAWRPEGAPVATSVAADAQICWDGLKATTGYTLDVTEAREAFDAPLGCFHPVWSELFQNAICHHDQPNGVVKVTSDRQDTCLRIRIQDDGPGVPGDFHEKVFAPFYTLLRRDETDRVGLGLAIAEKIVTQLGGQIRLQSPAGPRGCSVVIDLPVSASHGQAPTA